MSRTEPRADLPSSAADRDEVAAGDEAERRRNRLWSWVNLVYLIFAFLPLVFMEGDIGGALLATLIVVALFLPVYWFGFTLEGRRGLLAALTMAALGFALTPWSPGGNTLLIYAFISLALTQPWRRAVGVAVLLLLAYSAQLAVLGYPLVVLLVPLVIGGMVMGSTIVGRRDTESNAKLRLTQGEVDRLARMAERERIARDLHDLLGHTLSLIALKSELARRLAERDGSEAATHIGEVEQVARDALKEVRDAVSGMRSAELAAEFASARLALLSAGVRLDLRVDPLPALAPAQENALAMALREAVTNVIRHAGAKRVDVALVHEGRMLRLDVDDDGRGSAAAAGNGLSGMRERFAQLGGSVAFDGAAGAGSRLRVLLPLDAPAGLR